MDFLSRQLRRTQSLFGRKYLIDCVGLEADRVARLSGLEPGLLSK